MKIKHGYSYDTELILFVMIFSIVLVGIIPNLLLLIKAYK